MAMRNAPLALVERAACLAALWTDVVAYPLKISDADKRVDVGRSIDLYHHYEFGTELEDPILRSLLRACDYEARRPILPARHRLCSTRRTHPPPSACSSWS